MAIVKRGQRFQVKVRAPDGSWWSATCASRDDAKKVQREMRSARDLGQEWKHPRDRKVRLSFRVVAERYMRVHRTRLAKSTRLNRAWHLERFCDWADGLFKQFTVDKLSRALLERWTRELEEQGLAANSVRVMVQSPSCVWSWAYEYDEDEGWEGLIPRPRKPRLPKVPRTATLAPSWAEIDAMIRQIGPTWAQRSAALQRYTGARIGETLRLRWADVMWDQELLHFPAENTKGAYGGRVVPLHPDLLARLQSWERAGEWLFGDKAPTFTSRGYAATVYRRAWVASGARPQVYEKRPTHAIRKCVKTELRAVGAAPEAVDLIVGHQLKALDRAYIDPRAWDLPRVIGLIPTIGEDLE